MGDMGIWRFESEEEKESLGRWDRIRVYEMRQIKLIKYVEEFAEEGNQFCDM